MARIASMVFVVVLLTATTAAFALTEGLKLQQSPILGPRVDKLFSPVCACESATAGIRFRLRKGDRLDISVVDGQGDVVRTLVDNRRYERGPVAIGWDGRDDAGAVVREGVYRPRVHLARQHRTIEMPNEIRVDVTPPDVLSVTVAPRLISPDGDRRRDGLGVVYRLSEDASALLYVAGRRRVKTLFARTEGTLRWYGRVNGRPYPAGNYALDVAASDPAGNLGEPVSAGRVAIRYVALDPSVVRVVAGRRFAVAVDTDARSFRVRFARGSRSSADRSLLLRAPLRPGRYTLFVDANGHADRVSVVVVPAPAKADR